MARVIVVGGGLTGLAAAARLAKRRHQVTLLEAADGLGGAWARRSQGDRSVCDAPAVIGFPAPWRDLFRKSGRPLEAELSRAGRALIPAPPATYHFGDGAELVLPADRAGQFTALAGAYGERVATWWRDQLDALDDVWQALRPLGWEAPLVSPAQVRQARARLLPGRRLSDVAAAAPHPHLRALIRSVAHGLGSPPERTPAWCAVELSLTRTFGRWMVDDAQTAVLVDLLVERLNLRGVSVELRTRVQRIEREKSGTFVVHDEGAGRHRADIVVCTADPWQFVEQLAPAGLDRRSRRAVRRLHPAASPSITHQHVESELSADAPAVEETVQLSADGVPVITYRTAGTISVHDFRTPRPDPAWGVAWRSPRDLARRPRIVTQLPGLLLAGAGSAAGAGPSQVVLSAALASVAADDYAQMSISSGEDTSS